MQTRNRRHSLFARVLPVAALCIASTALATEHVVTQSGFTFSPASINVAVGDTVRFVRTGGTHTVTSGTGCTSSGLFNSPLSAAVRSYTWAVPASVAGTVVGYYCVPHCGSNMVGSITVAAAAPSPDIDGSGNVNASDLAMLLGNWGGKGNTDLDQDGVTGASDLSILLSAWTG